MKAFSTDRLNQRRIARRRALFFTSIFMFTGFATWFMADLFWRTGFGGVDRRADEVRRFRPRGVCAYG